MALNHVDIEDKHVEPRHCGISLPEQHRITNQYDTEAKVASTKETNPLEKQKNLEKQLDGDTKAVKTEAGVTSTEESEPLESGYNKKGKPVMNQKEQDHDDKTNKSNSPTTVETNKEEAKELTT